MKFNVDTAKNIYNVKNEYEQINILKELGFDFVETDWARDREVRIGDEVKIEINTLDKLMDFVKKYGSIVIDDNNKIIIYNGHLE